MRVPLRWFPALLFVRFASLPVAAHETGHGGGHTPWLEWIALGVLPVGLGVLAAGLYVDHARDDRSAYADACVVAGIVLSLGSMAVFWL